MDQPVARQDTAIFGIGSYSATEAARLVQMSPRSVRRWLSGYSYRDNGSVMHVPPLWESQHGVLQDYLELGFRDLIELRFVKAFIDAGLGLKAVRNCLDYARSCVDDDRPFSTRRFRTDGRTIFLEGLDRQGGAELLDLKRRQYVIKDVIERTFRDLDIEDDAVARWRPLDGKDTIVIDPHRAFGQPIVAAFGVPTVTLTDAVEAEGSPAQAARLFEVPISVVRDAVRFERRLQA